MLKSCVLIHIILLVAYSSINLIHAQGGRCKTPDNRDGNCIPISSCQPILQFLRNSPNPTTYQRTKLSQYQCELTGSSPKVCCPNDEINIPVSENALKRTSRPPTLDVSNHQNFKLLPTECGVTKIAYRIINGQVTGLFQFPWMALLSYQTNKGPQFKCGASIINERYILTAAHCITKTLLGVRVGEHNISSTRDCEEEDGVTLCAPPVQDIIFEKTIIHPNYVSPLTGYDIALIRLSTPMTISENVRPVCLPITSELINTNLVGKKLTVTGFGTTENASSSNVLLLAKIIVRPEDECKTQYKRQNIDVSDSQVCAGDSMGSDSCNGDSGGPLQGPNFIGNIEGPARVYQYGVVSIGPRPCANIEYPGIYTKVGSYITWILDNMES